MTSNTAAPHQNETCIASAFICEFEAEINTTRRFLEQLSNADLGWKPHEKSLSVGQLALHIAQIPSGVLAMTMNDSSQVPDSKNHTQPNSTREILSELESSAYYVRNTIPSITNERMFQTFTLHNNGETIIEAPRAVFLRTAMFNHLYHHRGQLGVYLRILGRTVPSSYGPSGDEPPQF